MVRQHLQGLIAAPFTPMHSDGSLNPGLIPLYYSMLKSNGIKGAFICGSTGEGVSLTINEKKAIAQILKNEGFITDFNIEGDVKKTLNIELKYGPNNEKVISGLRRISKPGLRVYAKVENLPSVLNGLGIAIISTSNGMMTDKEARKLSVGGEVLAFIW